MLSQTGSSLALGYTGQLTDPSTGFVDLRARELDPTLGRFLSADTVQPNAPGTQGYNLYAYTANNPTTWTDLSGNSVGDAALGAAVLLGRACLFFSWCRGPLADGVRRIAVGSNAGDWRIVAGGFSESVFAVVACALDGTCWNLAFVMNDLLLRYGGGAGTLDWTVDQARQAARDFPNDIAKVIPRDGTTTDERTPAVSPAAGSEFGRSWLLAAVGEWGEPEDALPKQRCIFRLILIWK